MEKKNVKIKALLTELGKLSDAEIETFAKESVVPNKVPEDSIVRKVVEKIWGEYSISRMIIVKAFITNILVDRKNNQTTGDKN